jgi:hypothetical protein
MEAIIALIITFFVGLALKVKGCSANKALALASLIMPSFFLITGFILPYKDGGASMWPIALIFGTIYGIIVGGLGVVAGAYFLKWQLRTHNNSE